MQEYRKKIKGAQGGCSVKNHAQLAERWLIVREQNADY